MGSGEYSMWEVARLMVCAWAGLFCPPSPMQESGYALAPGAHPAVEAWLCTVPRGPSQSDRIPLARVADGDGRAIAIAWQMEMLRPIAHDTLWGMDHGGGEKEWHARETPVHVSGHPAAPEGERWLEARVPHPDEEPPYAMREWLFRVDPDGHARLGAHRILALRPGERHGWGPEAPAGHEYPPAFRAHYATEGRRLVRVYDSLRAPELRCPALYPPEEYETAWRAWLRSMGRM